MHSALFVANEPDNKQIWFNFLDDASKSEKIKRHAERLAEGVWLVNFQDCPASLSFLICTAETRAISYRLLPLADAPQWLPVCPGPKPK
jgi:hypothetical protein